MKMTKHTQACQPKYSIQAHTTPEGILGSVSALCKEAHIVIVDVFNELNVCVTDSVTDSVVIGFGAQSLDPLPLTPS